MELTTLKNYVEQELGHSVEQADLEERFVWLIQGYHSMKGELTREDLTYIFETDMEIFENLGFLVDHYEVHLMGGPGIEYEVEESYDFFNYKEAKEAFERFDKSGYWVRLISVDFEGVFNDQTDEDNFNKN